MHEPHLPVLLNPWLDLLKERQLHIYVDATLGAGGHAKAVLEAHPEIDRFLGVDQDQEAILIAKERLLPWKERVEIIHDNFVNVSDYLQGVRVDAVLMDLGVSSMQLDRGERGFSFQKMGPLDMRMDQRAPLTAEVIINTWPEAELQRIFRDYGEEREWRASAKIIVQARKQKPIQTTKDLVELLAPFLSRGKKRTHHPLTKVFQAIRICVNSELESLRHAMPQVISHLKPGGLFGVIAFHSLEDRMVKNFFRHEASDKQDTSGLAGLFLEKEPTVKLVTKKALVASEEEMKKNPRARSARLRVVEKR